MGQRSTTETLFGIVSAFLERQTWSQAELARKLETRPETIRKHLHELQKGFKLERDEDHPHVYWSVPKNWMPGALAFKADEAKDLIRLIGRAPRGALRTRVLEMAIERFTANLGAATSNSNGGSLDLDLTEALHPAEVTPEEEKWLDIIEDAAAKKTSLRMRYLSASTGKDKSRHASVHRIDAGARPQFIATCHTANALRRFRVSNVIDARLDRAEPFRSITPAALAKFERESFGGFHDVGPVVHCEFFVRDPEAAWVAKNLPDPNIEQKDAKGGIRFSIDTTAVLNLARFVAGLGIVARPETKELAAEVTRLAGEALSNARAAASI